MTGRVFSFREIVCLMDESTMKNKGFTLIELMIAMAIATVVVAVIYSAYTIQTKIYTEQGKAAEMQQNARAALMLLQKEIRMAGYNPDGIKHISCNANPSVGPAIKPGIHTATATTIGFSMDLNKDGDCGDTGENVTYSIYTADGIKKLGRNDLTNALAIQPVAENITNINFIYLFQLPSDTISTGKTPTSTPGAADLDKIAAVQVGLLARASTQDQKQPVVLSVEVPSTDATGNIAAGGTVWNFKDSYQRQLLVSTINCRNLGLE